MNSRAAYNGPSGKAASSHANRRETTSEDESVNKGGIQSAVHVFVVDDDGNPLSGQDVAAQFSCAGAPDTVSHQYTDVEGHAEFSRKHRTEPLHVEIFVRGQSFGPYTVENAAAYTIEVTRK